MSLFKFPLQRLLDLRAKRQDEIARQLAQARAAADNSRAARDELAAARTAGQAQLSEAQAGSGATVGEIASASYALTQLDQRIAVASDALKAAETHVDQVHNALTGALQDKQVLDRLRERMLEAYRSTESHKDRTTMDAIALQRFGQSTGDAAKHGEKK
jgi:flagellar export protein FliJ